MPDIRRQIFAYSGVLKPVPGGRDSQSLIDYGIGLAAAGSLTRLCYVQTAAGDSREAIAYYISAFADRTDIEFSALRLFTQPSVPDVRLH